MSDAIWSGLEQTLPPILVIELKNAYNEMKNRYLLNDLRPNEVEGGRFAEAAFRILEFRTTNTFTPLGKPLATDNIIRQMANIPELKDVDAVRLHMPRALRVIYDIRNNRDVAHLADDIDPNLQDATLVVAICDWVMAEFVRLYHSVSGDEAYKIISGIVKKKLPLVQVFDGYLKTLNPGWGPSERILVTLYQRDAGGATIGELTTWLKPSQRPNIRRTLRKLEHDEDLIHIKDDRAFITFRGLKQVEEKKLLLPI